MTQLVTCSTGFLPCVDLGSPSKAFCGRGGVLQRVRRGYRGQACRPLAPRRQKIDLAVSCTYLMGTLLIPASACD